MDEVIAQIDKLQACFVERLKQAVEIPSVSSRGDCSDELLRMAEFIEIELGKLGIRTSRRYPKQPGENGETVEGPPILFARACPEGQEENSLPTILIYGHYDVQPAEETDGWSTPPFKFSHDQASGRMYGRGVTDDKGPVMGWINVIQAFQSAGVPLPVNLLFCLEGLEEVGSFDLEEILRSEISKGREGLLPSFDAVCISDTYWLGTTKPCLSYGLRGINFFILEISSGSKVDKHSGLGGTVQEPLNDLFRIYASMTNENGDINMPGVLELAKPLSERERTLYQGIDYELGAEAKHATTMEHLIALWHDPAISFHGIEGAFWGPGGKTIIPGCVKGKFSIRISSTMDPSAVAHAVEAHVANISNALDTKNTITLTLLGSQRGWQSNPFHWNFEAAEKATVKVWGTKPDYTREGGTIPITRMLADILSNGGRERETDEREKEPTNIMLFPMGRADDGAHSTNEKLDLVNYINGCKAFAWYLNEVGEMFREKRA